MSGDDERARRIGLNEAVFRNVNDELEALAERTGNAGLPLQLICECGTVECVEHLEMTRAGYEHLRSDALAFVVLPGHERLDIEDVVERRDGYNVVRKREPAAARAAAETNPRG